jgi:DNA-binding CsgD family transcriptional regulator
MNSGQHSATGLRRVLVDYAVVNGQLQGTVVLPGGRELSFANAAELERCLELGPGRLVLIDGSEQRGDDDGVASLSRIEREIARAALAGASNREIADSLFYSVKSVEAYLTRVYRRLGIEGRSGLPVVAGALEDLEPPPEQSELVAGGSSLTTGGAVTGDNAVVELLLV